MSSESLEYQIEDMVMTSTIVIDIRVIKYIGCYNVHNMTKTARVCQVADELARSKIEILVLNEVQ